MSFQQLAELCAKGVIDEYGFAVRMCVAGGKHPHVNPIKKLLLTHIKADSSFELALQAVDVSEPATRELRTAFLRTSVKL